MVAGHLELAVPSPLVELRDERLGSVRLLLKREDLISADLGGNKWRKLRYLLDDASRVGTRCLLTFGGAYSNHIRAVAAAGHHFGYRTIGVIRGEERPFNASLAQAVAHGMHLHYVSRSTYRRKRDSDVLTDLHGRFGPFYPIPEGGSTRFAVSGCADLVGEIDADFDLICCPVGTGGTLAGIAAGLGPGQRALGFSVLRGAKSLAADVSALHHAALGRSLDNWDIDHRFHSGGYARRTVELDRFSDDFRARHGIDLDRIYVAKMLFGIFAMIAGGEVAPGSTVVAVVTGSPWAADLVQARSTPNPRSSP